MEGPPLGAAFLCRLSMSLVSGLTCERTMWLSGRYHPGQAPDNVREQPIPPGTAQNADHFATSSPFSALFTEVVCDVGARPPQTAAAPPPIGGNCTTRGSDTPSEGFVSCKIPTATVVERTCGPGRPGRGVGGGGGARSRQMSHVISDGHFLRPPKNVAIPTR